MKRAIMDLVWLKRDLRLHDHGPLAVAQNGFAVLYVYEANQLPHGSHLAFVNEGLVDLDKRIGSGNNNSSSSSSSTVSNNFIATRNQLESNNDTKNTYSHKFKHLTVCHDTPVNVLQEIHVKHRIARLLAHQETGNLESYQRDIDVRQWCKQNNVKFIEYQQSAVTRGLKNRDDYSKNATKFLNAPLYPTRGDDITKSIVRLDDISTICHEPQSDIGIPDQHRADRPHRQVGGESHALATLKSFLLQRGADFSAGISSPNSAWTTGSRLSPFLAWGNISLRYVFHQTKARQQELRLAKSKSPWLKSLAAFSSRLHWRSHFIQKLESEPEFEIRDMHPAYKQMRRQPGDWNESYYQAWATGQTGFPFVDACMRCLDETGWINFRMRAMLTSFATYNLWLDWKGIAPHLARLFLDYEPGIHYPQLQMQSGTTGINATRVYNVTKQGHDQDPTGKFIRKYVPELANVPDLYIHEPWTMPLSVQRQCGVCIVGNDKNGNSGDDSKINNATTYPTCIVDLKTSTKNAMSKVYSIRNKKETKEMAKEVYAKHGSRSVRRPDGNPLKDSVGQKSIKSFFQAKRPAPEIVSSTVTEPAAKRTRARKK